MQGFYLLGDGCQCLPLQGGEVDDTAELVGTIVKLGGRQRLQLGDLQLRHALTQLVDLITGQRARPYSAHYNIFQPPSQSSSASSSSGKAVHYAVKRQKRYLKDEPSYVL